MPLLFLSSSFVPHSMAYIFLYTWVSYHISNALDSLICRITYRGGLSIQSTSRKQYKALKMESVVKRIALNSTWALWKFFKNLRTRLH